jgi:NAD(P)-dependent dehydrogenase (short-subunit alcohol dehydrogenase family)
MKIIITGHTKGIGQAICLNLALQGHKVIGVSRTTGYDLTTDVDRVVALAEGCDLFINNTGVAQEELLERLHNKVGKMIVMGSIAGDYNQLIQSDYSYAKMNLAKRCKELSLLPGNKIVHIKISMLEDAVSSDVLVPFSEVLDFVDFWIKHPLLTSVDYEFKLTAHTLEKVKEKFNVNQQAIDHVVASMCDTNRQAFND